MNYAIFAGGMFIGACIGFVLFALLGASHQADHLMELAEAYNDGVRVGKANPEAKHDVVKFERGY